MRSGGGRGPAPGRSRPRLADETAVRVCRERRLPAKRLTEHRAEVEVTVDARPRTFGEAVVAAEFTADFSGFRLVCEAE
ncbi:hypothetical protein [Streptomyces bottropensis]|uniref:hypothetical protein n=1 Tax=Streptomyces bottropensis TaxID=42235 RepID=UPI003680E53D